MKNLIALLIVATLAACTTPEPEASEIEALEARIVALEDREVGHDADIALNADNIETLFKNDVAFGEALEVQVEAVLNELKDADNLLIEGYDELLSIAMGHANNINLLMAGYVETDQPEPELAPVPNGSAFDPKGAGVYLAGVDMAPGIWRSSGTGDSDGECWLLVYDLAGERSGGGIEPVGFSLRIPAGDLQIIIGEYSPGCTWTWISE